MASGSAAGGITGEPAVSVGAAVSVVAGGRVPVEEDALGSGATVEDGDGVAGTSGALVPVGAAGDGAWVAGFSDEGLREAVGAAGGTGVPVLAGVGAGLPDGRGVVEPAGLPDGCVVGAGVVATGVVELFGAIVGSGAGDDSGSS